jgi:hypothetical protein
VSVAVRAATPTRDRSAVRSLPRLAFALVCVWASSPVLRSLVSACALQSRYGLDDAFASVFLGLGPVIVLVVAALSSARSERGLAIAGGLVMGAVGSLVLAPIAALTTAVAIAVDRPWGWARVREHVPLAGLGMLVGLCACGLTTDLAASVAPTMATQMHWWLPDSVVERATRALFEIGTLAAAIGFARERTWGALALGPAALGLAWCSVTFAGPRWGWGCVAYGHALGRSWELVLAPALVAIVPWAVPLARALRRTVREV